MSALETLAAQLAADRDLTAEQVGEAAEALTSPKAADDAKAAFLRALSAKGETAAELASFAVAFRARAVDPGLGDLSAGAIDVVGTGGDHAGGFNVSTLVVFVLASAGVPVMKHGNRGITSKCGSADLMDALGVDLEAPPDKLRRAMRELNFVFFFAPAYHPSFRQIAPVRRALAAQGQRTIFNILGPLVNPGRPGKILLGVYADSWVPRMAAASDALGTETGIAAHGVIGAGKGIDELTTATVNHVRGIGRLRELTAEWRAADFGLPQASLADLQGGDLAANLSLTEALVEGRGPAGLADTIVLNASVALWICGLTSRPAEGVARARELLVGGAVRRKIAATREFYAKGSG
jgi:anthranilate phosphoribosyltransferase